MIDFTDKKQVAKAIQYTNVTPNLTKEGLLAHLDVVMKYDFQAAMVPPCYVRLAKDVLKGTGINVATTLNFPQGNDTLSMKLAALKELIKEGADEFDFIPNPGLLLSGDEDAYFQEMKQIADMAHDNGLIVKTMLEFGFFNEEQKIKAVRYSSEAGIDWAKNSSGWGAGGIAATLEDTKLLVANVSGHTRVKISGKVNSLEKMKMFFEAGAEMAGTSTAPLIMKAFEE